MKRGVLLAVLAAATTMLWAQTGSTQPADESKALRMDVDTLKEGQTAIRKDLEEIKTLLRARPAAGPPAEAVVKFEGAPFKGKKDATLTLVDFTDYQ